MKARLWSLARQYWFDGLLVAAVAIGLVVTIGNRHKGGSNGPLWFDVLAVLAIVLPMLARRRFPFAAPVTVGVATAASSFVDDRFVPNNFPAFLVALSAVFVIATRRDRSQAVAGLALGIGVTAVVSHNDPLGGIGNFVFVSLIVGVVWVGGFTLGRKLAETAVAKERAERAEREREDQARLAVAEERARIARELHDVVGHAVSVMTVQAAGVRMLLKPELEREREALEVIERTGRDALAEMRRMVGVLRSLDEAPSLAPQPSLEHVDKLVEQARNAGLPVELRVEGEPVQLPAGVDLTAYRIVQEGLTNATKHSRAEHAEVLLRYSDGNLEVTISDDGSGDGGGESGGHGLVGMRERVSVYGGELEVGPRPEGGFALRARLPIG